MDFFWLYTKMTLVLHSKGKKDFMWQKASFLSDFLSARFSEVVTISRV